MYNKQFAKAFLKENGKTNEEKNKWIGAIIGEELTKLVENMFKTYEEVRSIGQQETPEALFKWVEEKFEEITKKDPKDYRFEIMTRADFSRFGGMEWVVRFQIKPMEERMREWSHNIFATGTAPTTGTSHDFWVNTSNNTHYTYSPIRSEWEQVTQNINYAEQLPPSNLIYNGTIYAGATVESIDTQYPYGTIQRTEAYAARPIDTVRVTERYGMGVINTRAIAATGPITMVDYGGNNNE